MKSFLFALLIAFVVSAIVQTEDKELEGLDIAKFIASLTGELKKLYKWLKSHGHWDEIVSLVKKGKSSEAKSVCLAYTGQGGICGDLVNGMSG